MATLEVALDASALTLADGAKVASFTDTSGNARHAVQATAWRQPTYLAEGPEGVPVVDFSLTDAYMTTSAFTEKVQPLTIFAVISGLGGRDFPQYVCDGITSTKRAALTALQPSALGLYNGTISLALSNTAWNPYRYPLEIFTARFDGANSYLHRHGGRLIDGDAGSNGITGFTLGKAYSLDTRTGDLQIAELRLYSGAMTTTEIAAVERELAEKWNTPLMNDDMVPVGDQQVLRMPDISTSTEVNVLMYVRGYNETADSITLNYEKGEIFDTFCRAGFVVVTGGGGTNYWASGTDLASYEDVFADMARNFNVSKVVLLAQSAGGIPAAHLMAQSFGYTVPADILIGIYPAFDLAAMYAQASFTASINSAYNIPGGGSYATQTAGHDPVLLSAGDFADLGRRHILTYSSYDDTVVPRTTHSDAMKALIGGGAAEFHIRNSFGDHGNHSHFKAQDALEFAQQALTGARRADDESWGA